ncbi:Rac guanyl-nucleotide exchange factor, partial [Clonorchis sinensis]
MSERCGTPEISAIVGQQTKEVEKALNNLDLEPVKRMQILNQVQSNLSAILYSQLASADMGFRASPNALDINTSNPSYHTPFMNGSIAVSCGDEMTITGTQPLIKSPGPITEHRPNSSRDIFTTDPAGSRTPVNPTPPPPPDVQERRRQELYRTNLRMHTTMRDQTREATVNADLAEEPTPVGRSSIVPPFLQNLLPVPSPRTKSTFGSVPGSGDETHPSPISTLRALNAKEYTGTKNTREFICPCKSEATCPLNPAKRCRFANDSRVARGFTLLAAAFRGRFIRQLLATHKVFDLIRTVKDSAKLALSIHVERAASGSKINDQKSSEFGLQADRYGRFSNEELALESRLLAQLRGALVQLHDIFFSWPLTSQIELLNVSRSLPQRNRRPLGKSGIPLEDQHSSGAKSDSFADDWTARDHYDQRRRKPSGLRCSQSQSEPEENGETRPLRELQFDQVNRFRTQVMARSPKDRTQEKLLDLGVQPGCTCLRRQPDGARAAESGSRRNTDPGTNQTIQSLRNKPAGPTEHHRQCWGSRQPADAASIHSRSSVHSAPAGSLTSRHTSSKSSVSCSASTTRTRVPLSSSPTVATSTGGTPNSQCVTRNSGRILSTFQSQSTAIHTSTSAKSKAHSPLGKRVNYRDHKKASLPVQGRSTESETQMDDQEAFWVEQSPCQFTKASHAVPLTRKVALLSKPERNSDVKTSTGLPFQPNVDRQSFRLGQVSGGPMVRAGNGGNISERSNQSSNHNRRPIS